MHLRAQRAIERPSRPVPLRDSSLDRALSNRKNRSNTCDCAAAGMPRPVSLISTSQCSGLDRRLRHAAIFWRVLDSIMKEIENYSPNQWFIAAKGYLFRRWW